MRLAWGRVRGFGSEVFTRQTYHPTSYSDRQLYDAADAHYLYHYDLGFEYILDANDGHGGVYLYDFTSNTFCYTSPTFPFPYLFDFSLNAFLYYYPDTTSAGHYTTNPRYFYNFAPSKIITK